MKDEEIINLYWNRQEKAIYSKSQAADTVMALV